MPLKTRRDLDNVFADPRALNDSYLVYRGYAFWGYLCEEQIQISPPSS
jgi:hypothetical protein